MKKRLVYLYMALFCFAMCAVIVYFFSDLLFIRGFIGDVLVTILLYCFIKFFVDIRPFKMSALILLISYTVEILQYFKFVEWIGLGDSRIARVVFGTVFDLKDLVAYTIGVIIIYLLDKRVLDKKIR